MSDTPKVLRGRLLDAVRDYGIAHWRLGVAGEHAGPNARDYDAEGMDAWRRVGETLDKLLETKE